MREMERCGCFPVASFRYPRCYTNGIRFGVDNRLYSSPLMIAVAEGLVPIMRLLLHAGAKRDHASFDSLTLSQQNLLWRVHTPPAAQERRYWPRPFRFRCANPLCVQTEENTQRTFYKCAHCLTERYCSSACSQAHWPAHYASTFETSDASFFSR